MPRLQIDVEARLAKVQDSLDQIGRSGDRLAKRLDTAFSGLRSTLAAVGVGLSAGAFAGFVKSGIDAADNLGKLSQRIGVTVESLSALEFAAKLSDVSTEQLSSGLARLARSASDAAAGSKESAEAFAQIGVAVQNAQGGLRGTEDLLLDLAERFSAIEDGSAKTAVAMRIFGRAGAELIPFLNLGRTGFAELRVEAERLGIVVSSSTAKAAEQFNDNMTRLGQSINGAKFALAESLLPALTRVSDEMAQVVRNGDGVLAFFKSLTALSPFNDLQRAQKELSDLTSELLSTENEIARRTGRASQEELSALNDYLGRTRKRIDEVRKLLGYLRGETNALGDPIVKKTRDDGGGGGLGNTGKDPQAKAGQQFLDSLRKRLVAVQENEYAVLRLEAAQRQVSDSAEPLIQQLQRETQWRKELAEAQTRDEQAANAERDRRIGLVQGVAEYIRSLERETSMMQLSNEERLIQTQLLELEAAGIDRSSEAYQTAANTLRQAVQQNAGARLFQETRTEMEKVRAELERYQALFIEGAIDSETYGRAVARLNDEFSRTRDSAKELKSAGDELGLTFTSAFEDAVVEGKKFSDVLKSIGQDISRIIVRKSITEPIGTAVSGAFKGSGFTDTIADFVKSFLPGFATGGQFTVGGAGGTDSQIVAFRATPGEAVTVSPPGRAGATGHSGDVHLHISTGVAATVRAEILAMLPTIRQAVSAGVLDDRRRGGSYAAAFR